MRYSLSAIVAMFAIVFNSARADELGTPIELSSFSELDSALDNSDESLDADVMPIAPVNSGGDASQIRPYVSGIVGASFGTINAGGSTRYVPISFNGTGSFSEAMLTGGGAIGMAIARPSGLLRMEVEGRARGPMTGQTGVFEYVYLDNTVGPVRPLKTTATNGWSAMVNFWRDYFFTDRLGVYGGGGFGVGGYQYAMQGNYFNNNDYIGSSTVNTFAWQIGTGITYQLNDRITFDTGYRFFAMSPGSTPVQVYFADQGPSYFLGGVTSSFSASELLLSVRIYEPFRNWR